MYYVNSNSTDFSAPAGAAASHVAATGALLFQIVLIFAVLIISVISMWKIFKKAGKPGWAAIVPIYNTVVLFQIVGLSPWLLLLALIPIVGSIAIAIVTILAYVKLAKAFGKSGGFAAGLIFLNIIFMPILAFSDAEYEGV